MKIRTLIVDDMPLARRRIKVYLGKYPEFEVVGECADGHEAVEAIKSLVPDLVFLDVQMPVCGGFEVVEKLGVENMPIVIFVTAYDEFALRAFEVVALDYILKPFDRARLEKAILRVKRQLN